MISLLSKKYIFFSRWFLLCITVFSNIAFTAETREKYREWKLVTSKNDIQVYQAHTADSKFKTFRGVARVHYDDLSVIPVILDDYEYLDDWMHMITEISELKRITKVERELYVKTEMPWPVKDRDGIVRLTFEQDPETYAVFIRYKNFDHTYGKRPGYVRMPVIEGVFSFVPVRDSHDIIATFEVVMDPGGYIPSFLANFIMDDIPYFTLEKMRNVVNMERYKGKNYDYIQRRPWIVAEESSK